MPVYIALLPCPSARFDFFALATTLCCNGDEMFMRLFDHFDASEVRGTIKSQDQEIVSTLCVPVEYCFNRVSLTWWSEWLRDIQPRGLTRTILI